MSMQHDPFKVIKSLNGCNYYSLKALQENLKNTTLERLPNQYSHRARIRLKKL